MARKRRRPSGPSFVLVSGLALAALAIGLLLAPNGHTVSARSSISAGSGQISDADLNAALRSRALLRSVTAATGVRMDGLSAALDVRRTSARRVVVEYSVGRPDSELRGVTGAAARGLAAAIAASDLSAAEERVRAAEATAARATAAIAGHEAATGIADPQQAVADAAARLTALQTSRDRAVEARSESVSVLEEQVAEAQQRMFDLQAVATRRATLVGRQRRAALALDTANNARRDASSRAAHPSSETDVVVTVGSRDAPRWRLVLAAVLVALAAAAIVAGVIGRRNRAARTRTRSGARTRGPSPPAREEPVAESVPAEPPVVASEAGVETKPRLDIDELRRRLDVLSEQAADPGDGGDDPRVDQRS